MKSCIFITTIEAAVRKLKRNKVLDSNGITGDVVMTKNFWLKQFIVSEVTLGMKETGGDIGARHHDTYMYTNEW